MKLGGLSLLSRTNSRTTFNLASWHSPHSLTWSWILALHWHGIRWAPHAMWKSYGMLSGKHWFAHIGLGPILYARVSRDNNGVHWGTALLGVGLSWSSQYPMWFRDLYWRRESERYERRRAA